MKILNIGNINYSGIKVLKDFSKDKEYKSEIIYKNMSDSFEKLNKEAESIEITTQREAKEEIQEEFSQKFIDGRDALDRKYKRFYQKPIKKIKHFNLKRRINKARQEALATVARSSNFEKKDRILDSMHIVFENGLKESIQEDKNIQYDAMRRNAIKSSDREIESRVKNPVSGFIDVAGYEFEKDVLYDVFISNVKKEQLGFDSEVPGSILFFGPWNNGKTYITKKTANEANCRMRAPARMRPENFMSILQKEAMDSQEHFLKTKERTIIFIDELDRNINQNSTINKEFEEFLKTCSQKYHCTVFAATNKPSILGLDLNDENVFPVRMSVDIPNDENLKAVLKFYLDDIVQDDIDYDIIVEELRQQEEKQGGRYNNSQFYWLPTCLIEKYVHGNISQEQLLALVQEDERMKPQLDIADIQAFEDEYQKFIGE